jgi:hypothetical protein
MINCHIFLIHQTKREGLAGETVVFNQVLSCYKNNLQEKSLEKKQGRENPLAETLFFVDFFCSEHN